MIALFPNMSLLSRLKWSMMAFGIAMGLVFPAYAHLFVHWKPGRFPFFAAGAIGAGITVGLVNHFMVRRMLVRHLESISRVAEALREGDLTARTELRSNDEVGRIAEHLDRSLESLAESFRTLTHHIKSVAMASNELDVSRSEAAEAFENLGAETVALEARLEQDQVTIRSGCQSAGALSTWLGGFSQALAEDATRLTEIANRSQEQAGEAGQLSGLLFTQTERTDKLAESMKSIDAFLNLVDDIVDQTEILSLNASIEAARSGEAGKGFAIVAQEIRNLARRSAQASRGIATEISQVQTLTSEIRTALQTIVTRIGMAAQHSETFSSAVRSQEQRIRDREADARATRASAEGDARKVAQALSGLAEIVERVRAMRTASERSRKGLDHTTAALRTMEQGFGDLRQLGASFRT